MKYEKVGKTFKKENIYLGTFTESAENTYELLKSRITPDVTTMVSSEQLDEMLMAFTNNGIIGLKNSDIFYKDENGYTYFTEEGCHTIKGDNSDGKGLLENVVSIWNYYKEDEVFELTLEDGTIIIAVENEMPINKYSNDYGLGDEPICR